ncbi:thioesterase domain-containing protein [Streptomyces sp. NPDC046985]|uniref:thioesterase II family protein n=1 Tax=Streptomyces sp. NPDC046985 TaxID=3155377 RepID=UPI0033C02A7F
MSNSNQSPVLVPWSPEKGNDTALICIPWAGAGAVPFRAWAPVIGDTADVYGVRLAGRENRQVEPPATALEDVVAELVSALTALGVPRVALFGHCSGALSAFEAARALRRSEAAPELVHLLVASQLPPQVFAGAPLVSDGDLTRYVPEDLRSEPELLDLLVPILTADMKLVANYAYATDAPLDVPLTVAYGARDEQLGRSEVDGWRLESTGPVTFHETAGADHLFSGAAWLDLAEAVRAALG